MPPFLCGSVRDGLQEGAQQRAGVGFRGCEAGVCAEASTASQEGENRRGKQSCCGLKRRFLLANEVQYLFCLFLHLSASDLRLPRQVRRRPVVRQEGVGSGGVQPLQAHLQQHPSGKSAAGGSGEAAVPHTSRSVSLLLLSLLELRFMINARL